MRESSTTRFATQIMSLLQGGKRTEHRPTSVDDAPTKKQVTVQEVLDCLQKTRKKVTDRGMSTTTFFLGVANLGISGFLLGILPQHFWLMYCFKVRSTRHILLAHMCTFDATDNVSARLSS
jgi:hypothetical protein